MRLGGLITLVALCAMTAPAYGATHQVNVGNNAFAPAELTVTQGDSVTWNWVGPDTDHTTTTEAGDQTSWDSDPTFTPADLVPKHEIGDKFSVDFNNPGEYPYFCKVHSFMTGKIVVIRKVNDPNGPPVDVQGPRFGTPKVQVKNRQVTFSIDEDAKLTAKLRGPTRRTITRNLRGGQNVLRLPKRLKSGRYALSMRAVDSAGNKSLVATVKFRVP